ncbi:DUF1996 domain-containing protein [Saccharopolyspora sp. ASAGF58]|uniref:DUF1996 domain-containing protein n=1 Tax=Saccharopolyspora sp. ASAGF58 TaxID=2719023 RepID=UPI00144007EF|nr:DUF1996 domain-containing protein [Saccharopolyspora sp. ASAGF58]QIZ37121.1 DUF1996 domain-containing protein [Saccharopolyspora sp. ASAGF58]
MSTSRRQSGRRAWRLAAVLLPVGLVAALGVGYVDGHGVHGDPGPVTGDFVDIADVPPMGPQNRFGPDASTGVLTVDCGRNDNAHRNADNVVAAPAVSGGAHHIHDYVGNLATDAFATDQSLAAAGTTCVNGDRSTYYWPVLRLLNGDEPGSADMPHNRGTILQPASVLISFRGNPASKVIPMPRFLRAVTGDAKALTTGLDNAARVHWTCSGMLDRRTNRYPRCPDGHRVVRVFDFPNCWDGRRNDSPNHRDHLVFPAGNGVCPTNSFAVPQLRIEVGYDVPSDAEYAIDTFPDQLRSPITDHSDFINVMTDEQMAHVVAAVNSGRIG